MARLGSLAILSDPFSVYTGPSSYLASPSIIDLANFADINEEELDRTESQWL